MKKYIIVGASAAGVSAVTELRRREPDAAITLLTAEPHLPYNKCWLVDYIAGNKSESQLFLRPDSFFTEQRITFVANDPVVRIDTFDKLVVAKSGATYWYDALLLASGVSARPSPSMINLCSNAVSFYTLSDAQRLYTLLKKELFKSAVVVGGGLTGLEIADALTQFIPSVTVLDRSQRLLPSLLGERGSEFLNRTWAEKNITYVPNISITDFITDNFKISAVRLCDERIIETDLLVWAAGTEQNLLYCSESGISCENGSVHVSETLQTSDASIWAAGDMITIPDRAAGTGKRKSVLWADAIQQGMIAARNMSGASEQYRGSFFTTATVLGGVTTLFGGALAATDAQILYSVSPTHCAEIALKENRLVGYAVTGNFEQKILLRRMLSERLSVSEEFLSIFIKNTSSQ